MEKKDSSIILYGYLSAIVATIIWSGNFIVARDLIDSIPPISLAFWRWMVAVTVLLPIAIKPLIADFPIIKGNILYLCVTSILGVSIFNTLIYIASHSTTAINLSLIAITFPIFIILISRVLYNELITINKWLGILLVTIGIVTLITKGDLSILQEINLKKGDMWMLVAAITFAIYSIMIKKKPKQLSTRSFQLITFLVGLIFLSPFYIWEATMSDFQIQSIDKNTFYSILYLGLGASLASYILWGKAVDKIGPTKSSMIYYTLPIFSGISAYIFLGEVIESIHMLSMLLIIIGVLTAVYEKKTT